MEKTIFNNLKNVNKNVVIHIKANNSKNNIQALRKRCLFLYNYIIVNIIYYEH